MNQTITVPGWVWLLIIAAIFIFIAILMVRKIGASELFLFGEERGANEFLRLYCFAVFVGIPVTCVMATVSHLSSS